MAKEGLWGEWGHPYWASPDSADLDKGNRHWYSCCMNKDRKLSGVNDVRAAYRAQATPMSDAERAWIDQAIDEGLASPPINDRSVQEIMAEIRTKNRARLG